MTYEPMPVGSLQGGPPVRECRCCGLDLPSDAPPTPAGEYPTCATCWRVPHHHNGLPIPAVGPPPKEPQGEVDYFAERF